MKDNLYRIPISNELKSKIIAKLRPIDDEFMRVMFKDDIPLAQFVLRILTEKKDLVITELETQRDLKKLAGGRSICLDAYGTDSKGKKYDLEIQRANAGADPYRARYHLSALDIENLGAGKDFKELPETYIIFVTEKDFFGKGEAVYRFERMNFKTGELFGDGEHIIYINGEYRGDDDLGKLMHDFNCADPNKMYFELLAERAKYFKEIKKGEEQMSEIVENAARSIVENAFDDIIEGMVGEIVEKNKEYWINYGMQEGIQQGMQEGIQQGIEENNIKTVKNMLADGLLTPQQISKYLGLSVEKIEEIRKSLMN